LHGGFASGGSLDRRAERLDAEHVTGDRIDLGGLAFRLRRLLGRFGTGGGDRLQSYQQANQETKHVTTPH
jgi:hypothetical protein